MVKKLFRPAVAITALMLGYNLSAAPPLQGSGTAESPYLISTKADVMALQTYVNGVVDGTTATSTQAKAGGDQCAGLYFAVTADIDMQADTTFIGIGTVPYGRASATSWYFSGHIDGRGHTIRNMRINGMVFKDDGSINTTATGSRKYVGFIGTLDNGSVYDLHFDSSCTATGNGAVGMVAGRLSKGSSVRGCSNSGTVRSYGNYAGGIAGDVTGNSTAPISIAGCWNTGTVYALTSYAGGIAGGLYFATIDNCLNTGRVDMHSFHSYKAEGNQEAGGGIVGYMQSTSTVSNCMNTGTVSVSKQYAGSLIGRNSTATKAFVTSNVALGYVDCPSLNYTGMISGGIPTTSPVFTDNYYDGSLWGNGAVATKEAAGCTPLSTGAFTTSTLPAGLDASLWMAQQGLYPRLRLQEALSLPAAQTYLLFPEGTDAANFGSQAQISTMGTITASVENDGTDETFYISDGKILARSASKVSTATVTLVNGSYTLQVPLTLIPVLFSGSGTQDDPYIIASRLDLENMAGMTNGAAIEHYTGVYFRQTADIDMEGVNFDGIACVQTGTNYPEKTYWFAGIYDGNGHSIRNLLIDRVKFDNSGVALSYTAGGGSAQNVGFFGTLGTGARVLNLTIESGSVRGYFNVGSIAGYAMDDVQITDCHNFASVTAYDGTVGGILGKSEVTSGVNTNLLTRCVNSGAVLANTDEAGGIVGYSKSILTDCINLGSVSIRRFNACIADAIGMEDAGGIAGTNQGDMIYCANFGAVTCDGSQTGGLTGFSSSGNKKGNIRGCYNAGMVKASDMTTCGALIGQNFLILNTTQNQEQCAFDSQYSGCNACDNADADFAVPLLTSEMVNMSDFLPAQGWIFEPGFYPINKALASNSAVRAACASYVLMPEKESALDFRSGTLPAVMPLTATIAGTNVISVNGNKVSADDSATDIANGIITIVNGDYRRQLALQYLPDMLPGKGTAAEPYRISSAADFSKLGSYMKRSGFSYTGKYFSLEADIDFAGTEFIMPGQNGNFFGGYFEGNGHSVSNVFTMAGANTEATSIGLFGGIAQGGSVSNLILKEFDIQANLNGGLLAGTVAGKVTGIRTDASSKVTGIKSTVLFTSATGENMGGICGYITANGRIENCINEASVTGYKYAGGINGHSDYAGTAYIGNCENRGTVLAMAPATTVPPTGGGAPTTQTVEAVAGGISGQIAGTVANCVNNGTVAANPCKVAGGIVGQMYVRTTIENCVNYGSVTAKDYIAGGIAGQSGVGTPSSGGLIKGCRNYGTVQAVNQLGGIAGITKAYTTLQGCANHADLHPTGMRAGGITGEVIASVSGYNSYALIEDCHNTGTMTGNGYLAGIAGYVSTNGLTINRCFNTGAVSASTTNGGAAGIANMYVAGNSVLNSYNAADITGLRYVGGICGTSTGVTVTNAYCTGTVTCSNATYRDKAAGHIVALQAENNNVTNCFYLPAESSFVTDDYYAGASSVTPAQLFEAPLGAAYSYQEYCFPMLASLDTADAAKAAAAYFLLGDSNTATNVSHSFPLGQPAGVTWSATGALRIEGNRVFPNGIGEATLTATCGNFSRSYSFNSTTAADVIDMDDETIRTIFYLPDGTEVTDPRPGTVVIAVSISASGKRKIEKRVIRGI